MSCERIREQFTWYLYNELSELERAALDEHVELCASCAAEMEKERALIESLQARPVAEPSAALLAECRHDLMRSVYREDRRRFEQSARPRIFGDWLTFRALWQPAAALCLVVMGFLGGWWMRSGARRSLQPVNLADASIAGISGVQIGANGAVEISFDETRRQILSGRMQDPEIEKMLIYAATSYGNPGVRLESIDILKERAGDRAVRNALLQLVGYDRNAGVRLKALESLKQYGQDPEVRRALARVLTGDDNPGMRVQAIDILMTAHDRNLVGVLQGVAEKEQNNYVRMKCRNALQEMNASVETF